MKLNKISSDMVSRRPDQTAEWLNRLARQVDIVEAQSASGSKKPDELPIATTYSLGVVKIGQNLSITPEGVLSAVAPTSYNYELLFNKPKINNVELIGNKSLSDLGIDIPTKTSELLNDGSDGTSTYVEADELATVATSGSYSDLLNKPTIGNATLTIQKNGTSVDTFTANATSNKTINITVPTTAADVGALPDTTKYAASLSLTINSSTFVVTGQLKDQDGNNLGAAQTIDLPLESVVVDGSYDSATKEVVLTLQNGNTIRFSVADLVSGLQTEITSANPLDADLVDDSTSTNKFVTSSDITTWNGKQDALTAGTNINIASNIISTQARGIEYIVGTQASATNLWTGVSTDNGCSSGTLYVGKTIAYYLPVAGNSTAATLNLTLPDGTTTGAIALRRQGGGNITTHFGANSIIVFIYDGTYWRTSAYYDSDTQCRLRNQNQVKAESTVRNNFMACGTSAGYKELLANATYDITYPLFWQGSGSTISAGATSNGFFRAYETRSLRNNKGGWTGDAYKVTYLFGTLSGNTFTVDSDVFTQTVPTSEDGKVYTPIGVAYSAYEVYFCPSNEYWQYKNGEFRPISHNVSVMTGASSGTAGTAGLVPAPAAGDNTKYLSGDGTWKTVSQYNLPIASASELGGVKIGSRLTINSTTGVLSADSQTDNNFTTTLKDKLDGIAAGAEVNVQANWTEADSSSDAYIKNKPSLATVATSGSYDDLSNKPTIPTVNNATLTIQKNGADVQTFTANQATNATANITVPTKTSELTNDSGFVTDTTSQDFAVQEGSTNPVFDDMTPLSSFEWDVSDTTYRPIYQMDNTGWALDNMDVTVAYRITVTGSEISQVTDVIDRWFNPVSWPVTSIMNRSLSGSAATTGYRYLRAVYPASTTYLNNNTYKFGQEVQQYNSTARHYKVEVFKTNSKVIWNTTKPAGSIYQGSSTYQGTNQITTYSTRGWIFRAAASFNATSADAAARVSSYESATIASSVIRSGAALTSGYIGFQSTDGKVYMITNTTADMVCDDNARIGIITTGYGNNTAIDTRYFRSVYNLSSTQVGYIPHATIALGDRVYLRCTMDSSGNIHSDNYLATSMTAGYTWLPFGTATASNTIYMDVRKPTFYTLNSSGKLTHINGKKTTPDITVTSVDPGEGSALGEDEYIAVTGAPDYSDMIDVFYPVGSYYETSDTSFNPNTAWAGTTWVEDTAGRVLVAMDSGTFATVDDTGGSETSTHRHWQSGGSDTGMFYDLTHTAAASEGLDSRVVTHSRVSIGASSSSNAMRQTSTYDAAASTLQPYIVVKRWHRVS